uniref:Cytochrome b561 domain-containing protein n=1 Tax=Rhabditophanes sp. KR3021 TaxID=114890 RepID=A0AC35U617_9BILA
MITLKSATWTTILMELVLSCVLFVSSLAVMAAQSNSIDLKGQRQHPSFSVILASILALSTILTCIQAMFALTHSRKSWLIPHIAIIIIVSGFHVVFSINWLNELSKFGNLADWITTVITCLLMQSLLFTSIYLDTRVYKYMD